MSIWAFLFIGSLGKIDHEVRYLWHSPNLVDKYYCQNLNGRNVNVALERELCFMRENSLAHHVEICLLFLLRLNYLKSLSVVMSKRNKLSDGVSDLPIYLSLCLLPVRT
jgi:hypothetical protein